MNLESLQKQINERCPCFVKPLNECDCSLDEEEDTSGLWGCTTCPYCGDWDYQIDVIGNCTNCGNTVETL